MQETTINFDEVKKTLLPVFSVRPSGRNKYLFPVYGKGSGNDNTNKDWYFIFLNPYDAIWIIAGEQISLMKRRPDFYQRFLNGSIKEISFSEFDIVATSLFKKIYNHIKDSDEIYSKWIVLSSNYYFRNTQNNTELSISEGFINFSQASQQSETKQNPATDEGWRYLPLVHADIALAVTELTEMMALFYRLFAPSQLGYKDYLNNVKQVPREKNHAKTP